MKRLATWALRALIGLVAVVVIAAVALFADSEIILNHHYPFTPAPLALAPSGGVASEGARIVRLYGCDGCHREDLRGQVMADIPWVARIGTPNLTVLAATNSDAQLAEIIRSGVRPDGRPLLVMPSGAISRLSDPEVSDVIAYIRSKPRGGVMGQGVQLGPMGRLGLVMGKFKTAPQLVAVTKARPLPDFGPETARGKALARACAECHGPDLSGDIGPDLRIAGAYDLTTFARLLRTGIGLDGHTVRPKGLPGENKTTGLMAEVAPSRFGGLSDAEVADLHAYLTTRVSHLPN